MGVVDNITKFNDYIGKIVNFFHNLPNEIAEGSVKLMQWVYTLCAELTMKTPLWIFNNEWFHNTTYLFSMVSISAVSVLSLFEAIKRILSGVKKKRSKPMDMKTIGRRWFLVAGASMVVPFAFQKAFQILNNISEFFISMGVSTMKTKPLAGDMPLLDILTLGVFDVILVSSIVPTLWKNGRRFFDLMVLGVVSPLALTAWIFDSKRHLYRQWWENLKHLSLVQVYQSMFMLVLGWFIFGIPTPSTFLGFIIKLLVVIGGFSRMTNPPRLVSKHLDSGGGFEEVYSGATSTYNRTKRNFKDSISIIMKPHSTGKVLFKRLAEKMATPERRGKTRMERFHQEPSKKKTKVKSNLRPRNKK